MFRSACRRRWAALMLVLLTLLLLVAAGLSISAFSLALSGWNGVSWAGNPTLFFWNTLPVFLLLGLIWLASGQAWLACLADLPPHRRQLLQGDVSG